MIPLLNFEYEWLISPAAFYTYLAGPLPRGLRCSNVVTGGGWKALLLGSYLKEVEEPSCRVTNVKMSESNVRKLLVPMRFRI